VPGALAINLVDQPGSHIKAVVGMVPLPMWMYTCSESGGSAVAARAASGESRWRED